MGVPDQKKIMASPFRIAPDFDKVLLNFLHKTSSAWASVWKVLSIQVTVCFKW